MSTKPVFSIIIPTHNREWLLKRAIDSVICQIFEIWELIVIDDGSTDGTAEMIHSLRESRIRYIYQAHGERSTARNNGIRLAAGQYICFLDDDDEYKPGYLQAFYTYYQKNNYAKTILRTGFVKQIGDIEKKSKLYGNRPGDNPVQFAAFHMCGIWTLSIPAEYLIEDIFHPDFPHWQDTHLILRLLAKHGMVQLPGHYYVYHIHPAMGSAKMGDDMEQKLTVNLQPIYHLFENHSALIQPFLPVYTCDFLIAKKYIEFAQVALHHGRKNLFRKWLKVSLRTHVSIRFWRYYTVIVRDWMKRIS
jgi:glycosyltransferase involved in cell wall biosynthesis